MFCVKCGAKLEENAKFCTTCGAPVYDENADVSQTDRKQEPLKEDRVEKTSADESRGGTDAALSGASVPSGEDTAVRQDAGAGSGQPLPEVEGDKNHKPFPWSIILIGLVIVLLICGIGTGGYLLVQKGYLPNPFSGDKQPVDIAEGSWDEESEEASEETGESEPEEPAGSGAVSASAEEQAVPESEEGGKEKIGGAVISGVPRAAYSYSFESALNGAKVVRRDGDTAEGYNSGTLPHTEEDSLAIYEAGIDGKAVYLDGSYGLLLDNAAPAGENYTVAFWVKPKEYVNFTPMFEVVSHFMNENNDTKWVVLNKKADDNGNDIFPVVWSCDAASDSWMEFHPSYGAGSSLDLNKWHYISLIVEGNRSGQTPGSVTASLFVDGEKVGTGDAAASAFAQNDSKVYLGINCWDKMFTGSFDEFKIWNISLSEQQIRKIYEAYGQVS